MWPFHSILISFIKLKIRFGVKFGVNGVWLSQVSGAHQYLCNKQYSPIFELQYLRHFYYITISNYKVKRAYTVIHYSIRSLSKFI